MSGIGSSAKAGTFDVEQLVGLAWRGEVRVPHFQRDFRWAWEDVRRLFDSIVRGYPIGSILLWQREAPNQRVTLGELTIEAPMSTTSLWVVDGQQRVTSLANALHPDSKTSRVFGLAYDLDRETFVRRPSGEVPNVVPLPVLFDLKSLLGWFARYPDTGELFDRAAEVTRRIRQYEVPAYSVQESDPKVLQDIFDRMNNFGKRLTRAEVFSALNAGTEESAGEHSFEQIGERIDAETRFGVIDENTVLAAVLARRGPDVRRDIRREFEGESEDERVAAYVAGEEALLRAVKFLQSDANVPHVSMLAYRYLLVVLTRIFAFHPEPGARERQLIRRWYWRAALAGPEQFKGGTPNAARLLLGHVYQQDLGRTLDELLTAVARSDVRKPSLARFNTNEAGTKIVLCSWWARGPRDPRTGEHVTLAQLASDVAERRTARDAVLPLVSPSLLPESARSSAAGRVLLPGTDTSAAEVPVLFVQEPLDLAAGMWNQVLASHCIPRVAMDAVHIGDGALFAQRRLTALASDLDSFLTRMTELRFEDTRPLRDFLLDDEEVDDHS